MVRSLPPVNTIIATLANLPRGSFCRFATKCYQREWGPCRYLQERYGRHVGTRIPASTVSILRS